MSKKESFELELNFRGDEITKEKVEKIWKILTNKSIPKVTAFVLENIEFEQITWKIKFS